MVNQPSLPNHGLHGIYLWHKVLRLDLGAMGTQSQRSQMKGTEETNMQDHSSYVSQCCLDLLTSSEMGRLSTYVVLKIWPKELVLIHPV